MELTYQQAKAFKKDHINLQGRKFEFRDNNYTIDFLFIAPADQKKLTEFLQSVRKARFLNVELEAGMFIPQFFPFYQDKVYDVQVKLTTDNPNYKGKIVREKRLKVKK